MVRDGFGDESGVKLIEQRGIDFAPAEVFIQSLKAAGASEAFLKALRAAQPPEPASAKKPLNQVQVFALLAGQVPSHRVAMLVQERGIDFEPTDDYLQEVRLAGGEDELMSALKSAKVTKPEHVDPAVQARQAEVRQHVAHGAELMQAKRYADAEAEFRAAVELDPENADLHANLGSALGSKGDWDAEVTEEREALRLNPNNDVAHANLGSGLGSKGDWDAEVTEEREALRLNPNNDVAHANLGAALGSKGDWDGEITEEREALRLNPNNAVAHVFLGIALGSKGDWDAEVTEEREALRLNPNNDVAHANLGVALAWKGDWDGEITEEREALLLNPNNASAHYNLGRGLENKGDVRGAIEEFRAAYELNPRNPGYRKDYERLFAPQPQKFYVFYMVSHSPGGELTVEDAAVRFESNTLQYSFVIPFADIQRVWDHVTDLGGFHRLQIRLRSGKKYEFNSGEGRDSQTEQIIRLINQKMGRH
jgi:tetratricopeptide (TPR) repeat protein